VRGDYSDRMSIDLGGSVIKRLLCLIALVASAPLCRAQSLPELPTLTLPAKGDTINMSVSGGSKSQLSFGSSTSMGVNVSLTASEGTSVGVKSMMAPAAGSEVVFSIGAGAEIGKTTAVIDNLKTEGSGSTTVGNGTIDSTGTNSKGSSGVAELTGVQAKLEYNFNPEKTGFEARANTIHDTYGAIPGQDGRQLGDASQTANGSGGASLNTNTNVDINSTTFTSVFMQAF